jgi:methyl-accepting chemotaxis protein
VLKKILDYLIVIIIIGLLAYICLRPDSQRERLQQIITNQQQIIDTNKSIITGLDKLSGEIGRISKGVGGVSAGLGEIADGLRTDAERVAEIQRLIDEQSEIYKRIGERN